MPLIPAPRRQRQMDLGEFEASLVYRASSRTDAKATEKPCLPSHATKDSNFKALRGIIPDDGDLAPL